MTTLRYTDIYAPLLNLPDSPKETGFTSVVCPFCTDQNGSAGVDLSTGVFHCLQCNTTLSAEKFIQKIKAADDPQTARLIVETYRKEKGIIENENNFSTNYSLSNKTFNLLFEESLKDKRNPLVLEYAEGRGISEEALDYCNIGFLPAEKTHWKRDSITFPYWSAGNIIGIRYRDAAGNKGGPAGCHFSLWGLDSIDETIHAAVLCEGESDRLRLITEILNAGLTNLAVLSTPGAQWRGEWEREFSGLSRIVVIPDSDTPGTKHAQAVKSALGDRVKIYSLPWRRGQIGTDVCDWLVHNSPEELVRAINSLTRTRAQSFIMTGDDFKEVANHERRYIVNNFLARQQIAVVGGQPKARKTWVLLNLFRTILDPGHNFLGLPGFCSKPNNDKILLLEEEGDIEELYQRISMVLDGTDWEKRLHIAHRLGYKLDETDSVNSLMEYMDKNEITVLACDPLQRLHSENENDAGEMAEVWNNVHRLLGSNDNLSVVVLHHFHKTATIDDLWNGFRGSSRTAAEADLGMFIEKLPKREGLGIRAKFDGRTLKPMESSEGKDTFRFRFEEETGFFAPITGAVAVDKHLSLLAELQERKEWQIEDAAKHFNVSEKTIHNWAKRLKDEGVYHIHPAEGRKGAYGLRIGRNTP